MNRFPPYFLTPEKYRFLDRVTPWDCLGPMCHGRGFCRVPAGSKSPRSEQLGLPINRQSLTLWGHRAEANASLHSFGWRTGFTATGSCVSTVLAACAAKGSVRTKSQGQRQFWYVRTNKAWETKNLRVYLQRSIWTFIERLEMSFTSFDQWLTTLEIHRLL